MSTKYQLVKELSVYVDSVTPLMSDENMRFLSGGMRLSREALIQLSNAVRYNKSYAYQLVSDWVVLGIIRKHRNFLYVILRALKKPVL